MSESDILLTLYSIVAGLGISRLVQGLASMIEQRKRMHLYWVHSAWLLIILAAHVVTIFALIRFSGHSHWTVFNAMLALTMPLLLYLVSDLIVPTIGDEEQVDLRAYFYANRRWFCSLMIMLTLVAMAVQVAVERRMDVGPGGSLRAVALLALSGGLASARPAVQSLVVLVLLAVIVVGAALVSAEFM